MTPRGFGTLLDGGPATDTSGPLCQVPGCGRRAGFRQRAGGPVDRPVYSEAWCLLHVPASWFPARAG